MEWIVIENNTITEHCCGEKAPDNAIIVENFNGFVGDSVTVYDDNWQRKSDHQLIIEGVFPPPTGYKVLNKELVEMSQVEKIEAGLEKCPENYIVEDGELKYLTESERYKRGLLSTEEYAITKRRERDFLLQQTDKFLLQDFPIDDVKLLKVKEYRQYLRDLPELKDFPDVKIEKLEV